MGKPKGRNNIDLDVEELKRVAKGFVSLVESCRVADEDNLIKIRIELKDIHEKLKAIDAQNKAMYRLYGVLYTMLAEPEKPHDRFELFTDQGDQTGSHFDPNT